ncbi:hypothetical protein SUGI_0292810 [Cryptomeria japonica]|nr:hypothetical protein SUGI_0292810 [Cryptomeria japonica]
MKTKEDIAKEMERDWKGLRVTMKITMQNRQAKVAFVLSVANLMIKPLKESKRDQKKTKKIKHNENILLDDVRKTVKVMRPQSMAKTFARAVKEILGTCVSIGCTVDDKDPKDLQIKIDGGEFKITEDSFK